MALRIASHQHGKGSVRVGKRYVADGQEYFIDLSCEVTVWTPQAETAFTIGDNNSVVATDTCKNIAYIVAKESTFSSPEEFAIQYAERFIEKFPFVTKACAVVKQVPWVRAVVDGRPHNHAFVRGAGDEKWCATATAERACPTVVTSSIEGLVVLKTTKSGWEGFHTNEYRLLPDVNERMLASSVTARWEFGSGSAPVGGYCALRDKVKATLIKGFAGPPDTGVYSPGVQFTLHKMGKAALEAIPSMKSITLSMPNIHYLPAKVLDAMGIHKFEDDIFIPTDEPYGMIEATMVRSTSKL